MMHGDELVLLKRTNLMMEISVNLSLVCTRFWDMRVNKLFREKLHAVQLEEQDGSTKTKHDNPALQKVS